MSLVRQGRRVSSIIGHREGLLSDKRLFLFRLPRRLVEAATTAIRFEPDSTAYYERLRSQGKLHKVPLVAVMRKLISLLTTLLRGNRL